MEGRGVVNIKRDHILECNVYSLKSSSGSVIENVLF